MLTVRNLLGIAVALLSAAGLLTLLFWGEISIDAAPPDTRSQVISTGRDWTVRDLDGVPVLTPAGWTADTDF